MDKILDYAKLQKQFVSDRVNKIGIFCPDRETSDFLLESLSNKGWFWNSNQPLLAGNSFNIYKETTIYMLNVQDKRISISSTEYVKENEASYYSLDIFLESDKLEKEVEEKSDKGELTLTSVMNTIVVLQNNKRKTMEQILLELGKDLGKLNKEYLESSNLSLESLTNAFNNILRLSVLSKIKSKELLMKSANKSIEEYKDIKKTNNFVE